MKATVDKCDWRTATKLRVLFLGMSGMARFFGLALTAPFSVKARRTLEGWRTKQTSRPWPRAECMN